MNAPRKTLADVIDFSRLMREAKERDEERVSDHIKAKENREETEGFLGIWPGEFKGNLYEDQ